MRRLLGICLGVFFLTGRFAGCTTDEIKIYVDITGAPQNTADLVVKASVNMFAFHGDPKHYTQNLGSGRIGLYIPKTSQGTLHVDIMAYSSEPCLLAEGTGDQVASPDTVVPIMWTLRTRPYCPDMAPPTPNPDQSAPPTPGCGGGPACGMDSACCANVCVPLQTDKNCGGCGDSCLPFMCAQGRCQTPRSCKDILSASPNIPSGHYSIKSAGSNPIKVYCNMTDGGWTLVYSRNNPYFSPDQMYHVYPDIAGPEPDGSSNSESWFIPDGSTQWRWEYSLDGRATYKGIVESIPAEAKQGVVNTTSVLLTNYKDEINATNHQYYFQSVSSSDWNSMYSKYNCGSGGATWFGLVNVMQGAGDQTNPGIGGHCDNCSLNNGSLPSEHYTWGNGNLEIYWGDNKNFAGDFGGGGTFCRPNIAPTSVGMRIWAQ